jgi:hypothetical protein
LMIVLQTNVIMNALLTRGIDYGTPATSVIRAATSDLQVKAVAVLTGRPDYFLAVRKEFKSLKDLKGKRIAIGMFNAAADIIASNCAPARRVGPGARRDSFTSGWGRFASRRSDWWYRRCDDSEFSIQSAGEKIGFQHPALAWGAIGDASVRSCPEWGSEMKRYDSTEPRAGSRIAQGDSSGGGLREDSSGRWRVVLHGMDPGQSRTCCQELRVRDEELAGESGPFPCGDQSRR